MVFSLRSRHQRKALGREPQDEFGPALAARETGDRAMPDNI